MIKLAAIWALIRAKRFMVVVEYDKTRTLRRWNENFTIGAVETVVRNLNTELDYTSADEHVKEVERILGNKL